MWKGDLELIGGDEGLVKAQALADAIVSKIQEAEAVRGLFGDEATVAGDDKVLPGSLTIDEDDIAKVLSGLDERDMDLEGIGVIEFETQEEAMAFTRVLQGLVSKALEKYGIEATITPGVVKIREGDEEGGDEEDDFYEKSQEIYESLLTVHREAFSRSVAAGHDKDVEESVRHILVPLRELLIEKIGIASKMISDPPSDELFGAFESFGVPLTPEMKQAMLQMVVEKELTKDIADALAQAYSFGFIMGDRIRGGEIEVEFPEIRGCERETCENRVCIFNVNAFTEDEVKEEIGKSE